MIIDAHTHVWQRWPYKPVPPDVETRGSAELLIHEMDTHGVDQAVVICASISGNPVNADYAAGAVQRYADRLHLFPDVDCVWHDTHHTAGAADRLEAAASRDVPVRGFTHYLRDDDDGQWLLSDQGLAMFERAEQLGLIASLSIKPIAQPALRELAGRFPGVPILCHHLGWAQVDEPEPYEQLKQVLASAERENIYVKVSGFAHASPRQWDFPYTGTHRIIRALYEHFGPARLCWGSDHPVVTRAMTYQQALEAFRTHCDFIPPADREQILGGTMQRLLAG